MIVQHQEVGPETIYTHIAKKKKMDSTDYMNIFVDTALIIRDEEASSFRTVGNAAGVRGGGDLEGAGGRKGKGERD